MRKKVHTSVIEQHLSTVPSGNPWHKKARGACRWGKDDYVLWENGKLVHENAKSVSEAVAREFVATGELPLKIIFFVA
mgnify:CR=1 FL=1